MRALAIVAVLALAACERPAADTPEPTRIEEAVNLAEMRELEGIERACLAEQRRNPGNAMSCDWGSLDEARQWRPRP